MYVPLFKSKVISVYQPKERKLGHWFFYMLSLRVAYGVFSAKQKNKVSGFIDSEDSKVNFIP
jgi:hypothetical protein